MGQSFEDGKVRLIIRGVTAESLAQRPGKAYVASILHGDRDPDCGCFVNSSQFHSLRSLALCQSRDGLSFYKVIDHVSLSVISSKSSIQRNNHHV